VVLHPGIGLQRRPAHAGEELRWRTGLSAAPTVVDGAVVAGSLDGFLRAVSSDTARSFDTVNGIPGKGGSIDNASIVAAGGYLFVNSGYGLMGGQTGGNVFLAFRAQRPAAAAR
jgi:polyvinyl alcohol dehydrogenase (cytochrome)